MAPGDDLVPRYPSAECAQVLKSPEAGAPSNPVLITKTTDRRSGGAPDDPFQLLDDQGSARRAKAFSFSRGTTNKTDAEKESDTCATSCRRGAFPTKTNWTVRRSKTMPESLPSRDGDLGGITSFSSSKKRSDSAASLPDPATAFFELCDDDDDAFFGRGAPRASPFDVDSEGEEEEEEVFVDTPYAVREKELSSRSLSSRRRRHHPFLSEKPPRGATTNRLFPSSSSSSTTAPERDESGERRRYPSIALERCASLLELRDVAAFGATCREWRDALSEDAVWREQWLRRLGSYSYLSRRVCILADAASSRETLKEAVRDETRTMLTLEELTSFEWRFRFKRAAGESWMAVDPYWCRKPARALKFLKDGTTRRTSSSSASYLDDLPVEWRWGNDESMLLPPDNNNNNNRASPPPPPPSEEEEEEEEEESRASSLNQGTGPCDRVKTRVDGQDVPTYLVSRHPKHKGFMMQSCWALYTAFPMPGPGQDPDLDDEVLERAFASRLAPEARREAREQALRYNLALSGGASSDVQNLVLQGGGDLGLVEAATPTTMAVATPPPPPPLPAAQYVDVDAFDAILRRDADADVVRDALRPPPSS